MTEHKDKFYSGYSGDVSKEEMFRRCRSMTEHNQRERIEDIAYKFFDDEIDGYLDGACDDDRIRIVKAFKKIIKEQSERRAKPLREASQKLIDDDYNDYDGNFQRLEEALAKDKEWGSDDN